MIVLKILLEAKNLTNVGFIYGRSIVVSWTKSSIPYVDGSVSDSVIRNEGDKWSAIETSDDNNGYSENIRTNFYNQISDITTE